MNPKHPASISLISLLIISAFTLILVVAMSENNISTGYQYLNHQLDNELYYAAEACLEEAMIRLEDDPNFNSTNFTVRESVECTATASGSTNPRTIEVEVTTEDHTQNFQAEGDLDQNGEIYNFNLTSWEEI